MRSIVSLEAMSPSSANRVSICAGGLACRHQLTVVAVEKSTADHHERGQRGEAERDRPSHPHHVERIVRITLRQ